MMRLIISVAINAGHDYAQDSNPISFSQILDCCLPVVSPDQNFIMSSISLIGLKQGIALHACVTILFPIIPLITYHFFNIFISTHCILSIMVQLPNIIYTANYIKDNHDICIACLYIALCAISPIISIFLLAVPLYCLDIVVNVLILGEYYCNGFPENMSDDEYRVPVRYMHAGLTFMFVFGYDWTFFTVYYTWNLYKYHKIWFGKFGANLEINFYDQDACKYDPGYSQYLQPPSNFDEGISITAQLSPTVYRSVKKIFGTYPAWLHALTCFCAVSLIYKFAYLNPVLVVFLVSLFLQLPNLLVNLIFINNPPLTFGEIATEFICYVIMPCLCAYFNWLPFVLIGLRTICSIARYFIYGKPITILPTKLLFAGLALLDYDFFVICYYLFLLHKNLSHWSAEIIPQSKITASNWAKRAYRLDQNGIVVDDLRILGMKITKYDKCDFVVLSPNN